MKTTTRRKRPVRFSGETKTKVSTLAKDGYEEEKLNESEMQSFAMDPAYVTVGVGVTKNTGNFESLRIDVRISKPCEPNKVDETFKEVSDKVSQLLCDEIDVYLEKD